MDLQTQNEVTFFFGISKLNRDDVDEWNPADLGKVEFSTDLDISSGESQASLKKFCANLKEAEFISGS